MNFDFDALDLGKAAECGRNRAAPARGHGFLVRYQDPRVRDAVRGQLAQMRQAGFRAIRTLVFFGKANEGAGRSGSNIFALERPALAAENLSAFAGDVRQAGFSELHVGFGPQGTAAVACRRRQWGDCFDPDSIRQSVKFILTVRGGLGASAPPLFVDLENEGGLTHFHPPSLRKNMGTYLATLIGAYLGRFPHDRTTISVQERQPGERLAYVLAAYARFGARPAYLDFHIYHPTAATLVEIGGALRSLPERFPLVIGEFNYGDPGGLRRLDSLLIAPLAGGNVPVIFWPLRDVSGRCGVDTPPPYDLRWTPSN